MVEGKMRSSNIAVPRAAISSAAKHLADDSDMENVARRLI
jgi:hypothetical protein